MKKTRIKSLSRAFLILNEIANHKEGLQIKEISYNLGINIGTCYHFLNTLEDEGYVVKSTDNYYLLGPNIPILFNKYIHSNSPNKILQEKLYELRKSTNESCYLASVKQKKVDMQLILESTHLVQANFIVHSNDFPHARVITRAIMAFWDEKDIIDFFENYEFRVFTSNTPKNLKELKQTYKEIRSKGYSIDEPGMYKDARCIATPIFDHSGMPIAAYGIAVPNIRFNKNKDMLIETLLKITKEVSLTFGFDESLFNLKHNNG